MNEITDALVTRLYAPPGPKSGREAVASPERGGC